MALAKERAMEYAVIEAAGMQVVEVARDGWRIASEGDALDLVAACGESGAQRLLLHAESLSPDFFQLSSGLAGAVLLKFVTYQLKVALVAGDGQARQGKFHEFALETNRGRDFRIFSGRQAALDWLVSG
jgi:hypothetical protein